MRRIAAADLPDIIPVFPLPGALLLPRTRLPLHLFEPRYLAMLEDVLKTSTRLVGMVQPMREGDPRLHSIGCAGRLTSFTELPDGRCMISLTGASRFRITEEVEGFTPYTRCLVRWQGFEADLGPAETDAGLNRATLIPLLRRFFDERGLSTDWDGLQEAEDEPLINSLSMMCPFSVEDKQALLEAPSLLTRRETLVTLIEFALRAGNDEEMRH
jgi:Lon protease-like protein